MAKYLYLGTNFKPLQSTSVCTMYLLKNEHCMNEPESHFRRGYLLVLRPEVHPRSEARRSLSLSRRLHRVVPVVWLARPLLWRSAWTAGVLGVMPGRPAASPTEFCVKLLWPVHGVLSTALLLPLCPVLFRSTAQPYLPLEFVLNVH